MKKEENIILNILKYNTDENLKEILKDKNINWIKILGYLTYHRVAGLAYEKINNINIRLFDYPVFLTTYLINQAQKIRSSEQHKWISLISKELIKNKINHVFLKGSVLSNTLYNCGSRASNDIDLLINKRDIISTTEILNSLGFKQGKFDYKNNKVIEFSSLEKEEILNKRGETAPFIKTCDIPTMKTIDIDVNFSIDWNPDCNEELIETLLNNKIIIQNETTKDSIYSLCHEHNFIELCIHLYKDSALIDILKKRKVLDLYKFIDVYYFIMKYFEEINLEKLHNTISTYKLDNYIYFTLVHIISIFPDTKTPKIEKLLNLLHPEKDIINMIFDQYNPKNKLFTHKNILERIFTYDIINIYGDENE